MRTLLLSAALLVPALASAQTGEAFVEQAFAEAGATGAFSGTGLDPAEALSTIGIATDRNALSLDQRGSLNEVTLAQTGTNSAAVITQIGNENLLSLLQAGDDNVFLAVIVGDGQLTDAVQDGNGNRYALLMEDPLVTGVPHTILQEGDGNVLTQIVGPGTAPVDVEQRGVGFEVTVERR
ncbi:MAG: curlin repeat-containing protein [Bacteroidota bacterium]